MKILKNRSFAGFVLAIVILFGTVYAVRRTVGKEVSKIESQFYDGVYLEDEKYTQASIDDMLTERSNAALGIIGLEGLDTAELREARNSLTEAETIEEKYLANEALKKASVKLKNATVSDTRITEGLSIYLEKLDSAQKVIDASDYNRLVQKYINDDMNEFPVKYFKTFCELPQYFNVEG